MTGSRTAPAGSVPRHCLLAFIGCFLTLSAANAANDDAAVAAVLDDFHAAAAAADGARYLGHFAPEGVFLGTDDWERWPLAAFREYVAERFADGGWTYYPRSGM